MSDWVSEQKESPINRLSIMAAADADSLKWKYFGKDTAYQSIIKGIAQTYS